jgi:hypothetical protein
MAEIDEYGDVPDAEVKSCPTCGAVEDIEYSSAANSLTGQCACSDSDPDASLLAEQIARFGIQAEDLLDELQRNLGSRWFRDEVIRVAVSRLVEGFDEYGRQMYDWDEDTRDRNMFEELADWVVYGSSGPHFRCEP